MERSSQLFQNPFNAIRTDSAQRIVAWLASDPTASGSPHAVVLGSYFSHFDKQWPQMELSRWHPYIKGRREQEAWRHLKSVAGKRGKRKKEGRL